MSKFKKILQSLSLDRSFFLKAGQLAAAEEGNAKKPIKFWFYAESIGEFRLALFISKTIRKLLTHSGFTVKPVFYISFKTASVLPLARKLVDGQHKINDTVYFFHPVSVSSMFIKPYIENIRPDYFFCIEHFASPALTVGLMKSGAKLFFIGINPELGREKHIISFLKKIKKPLLKENITFQYTVEGEAGKKIIENILIKLGISKMAKITSFPFQLKLSVFFNGEKPVSIMREQDHKTSSQNLVLSFVSIHKMESLFITGLISKITGDPKTGKNLKFILAPRNIKLSGMIYKRIIDAGMSPVFFTGIRDIYSGFIDNNEFNILIINDYGVLDDVYRYSDLVYVGKSLYERERGGHNIIEPASFGKPVITGKYADNFSAAVMELSKSGGVKIVSPDNFERTVMEFIGEPGSMSAAGANLLKFCNDKAAQFKRGLEEFLLDTIIKKYGEPLK